MKKVHILLLIAVVAAIGVVLSLSMNTSTYANFDEAREYPNREFHVIGTLNADKPVDYNVVQDANSFTFFMIDNAGNESRVKYLDSKPQDFEKLDQIVVIGKMKDDHFEAHKMNLKCPSKYNNDSIPAAYEVKNYSGT